MSADNGRNVRVRSTTPCAKESKLQRNEAREVEKGRKVVIEYKAQERG